MYFNDLSIFGLHETMNSTAYQLECTGQQKEMTASAKHFCSNIWMNFTLAQSATKRESQLRSTGNSEIAAEQYAKYGKSADERKLLITNFWRYCWDSCCYVSGIVLVWSWRIWFLGLWKAFDKRFERNLHLSIWDCICETFLLKHLDELCACTKRNKERKSITIDWKQ